MATITYKKKTIRMLYHIRRVCFGRDAIIATFFRRWRSNVLEVRDAITEDDVLWF